MRKNSAVLGGLLGVLVSWCLIAGPAAAEAPKLRALFVTGGGYHDYETLAPLLCRKIAEHASVRFEIQWGIEAFADPHRADPFDVIVFDLCQEDVDMAPIDNALAAVRGGKPAVFLHCAVHCLRKSEGWRECCGEMSKVHDPFQSFGTVKVDKDHPIVKAWPDDWTTPGDELYQTIALGKDSHALLTAKSPKTGDVHTVAWTREHEKERVFATTLGHDLQTAGMTVYHELVARGLLWACRKLGDDGKPAAGCEGTGPKPQVVFVTGSDEYEPEKSMASLADDLETKHGVQCLLVNDKVAKSNWQPKPGERSNDMPGLGALAGADLAVFFMRFRELPEEQVNRIAAYLDSGKSVAGFRTATHAFNYAEGDPLAATWNAFGKDVLGAPWIYHYGHESSTDVVALPQQQSHPILKGVDPEFHVRSWLYQVKPEYPPQDATVLFLGKSTGPSGRKEREDNPVAWTRQTKAGGRVFFTTMGHPEDFQVPAFRRLAVNGILWTLGK